MNKKADKIKLMLVSCNHPYEAMFLIRGLTGKLRIQCSHATLLAAVAQSSHFYFPELKKHGDEKEAEQEIKSAYVQHPDLELLTDTIWARGWYNLTDIIHLSPGVPTKPMLAKPTKGIEEVLKRFDDCGEFTCEWKYDGERAQIHIREDGTINVYSRNQENTTDKYPDVIERMEEILKHPDNKVTSCILDSESVAYRVILQMSFSWR